MAVRKKVATKKVAKKVAAKPAVATAPAVKAIATKMTKTQIITAISEGTQLAKKDVAAVFAHLGHLIEAHVKRRGSGEFTIPDTMQYFENITLTSPIPESISAVSRSQQGRRGWVATRRPARP